MRYLTAEEVAQINAEVAGEGLLRDAGLLAKIDVRKLAEFFEAHAAPLDYGQSDA